MLPDAQIGGVLTSKSHSCNVCYNKLVFEHVCSAKHQRISEVKKTHKSLTIICVAVHFEDVIAH